MILPQVLCWVAIGYLSVANVLNLYIPVVRSIEPPETDYTAVTDFLEENGYLLAYATFENANTMTIISNGRVRVAPVASIGRMDCCKWLSSQSWYPPYVAQEQTTAYIVTESQMPEFAFFLSEKEEQVKKVQQIGKFHIYVSDYNYVN